ncbi:MAG TPA: cytochrome P450 [Polyangiaceae bacterium]|nr:cytochrome P450 [Polyangiaceae bacterium]
MKPQQDDSGKRAAGSLALAPRAIPFPAEQSSLLYAVRHYGGNPLLRFIDLSRNYPDVVGFRFMGRDIVVIHDLDFIEQILLSKHALFEKDAFTAELSVVLGDGLLTSKAESHRLHRRLIAPSLASAEVSEYVSSFWDCAQRFISRLEDGAEIELQSSMMRLTLEVLTETLFGQEFEEFALLHREMARVMRAFNPWSEALRGLLPTWVPMLSRRDLRVARERLKGCVQRFVARKRSAGHRGDLLSRLIAARDEGKGLSDEDLCDEVLTLMAAGHETTALSLTYAFRLLALHPDVRAQVQAEVDVFTSTKPSAETLAALSYTHAMFQEALRLYPPAWTLGRQALEDCTIAGWQVKKGYQLMVPWYSIHRHPRWHAEPDEFRPERFLPAFQESKPPRFAYAPFGGGPRVCVGLHFAMVEAMTLLAAICQRVQFTLLDTRELPLTPSVTLRPGRPVRARINLR